MNEEKNWKNLTLLKNKLYENLTPTNHRLGKFFIER